VAKKVYALACGSVPTERNECKRGKRGSDVEEIASSKTIAVLRLGVGASADLRKHDRR